jgi:hypothetical protein
MAEEKNIKIKLKTEPSSTLNLEEKLTVVRNGRQRP